MFDVLIIGAGVTGCAVARWLSRYRVSVCVAERCEDVCCGTSKANSAIVHAGFDAAQGSLMAKMNVEGNRMMAPLAKALDIPFRQNGSLVVCQHKEDLPALRGLYERGLANGVQELALLSGGQARALEPHLSSKVIAALWAPTGGIICPFTLTLALAENAAQNGVEFRFDTPVTAISRTADGWTAQTPRGAIRAKCVVNAAGLYADVFHNMVCAKKIHITPRRGEYCLLDKTTGEFVRHTVFPVPGKYGKGVLVSPTIHGNTIVGPTAVDTDDREETRTTAEGLADLIAKAGDSVEGLPIGEVITSFAGLRAHEDGHEFILGEAADAPGFFDCAGIESPGLTSSPAIGKFTAEKLRDKLNLTEKDDFISTRTGIVRPAELPLAQRAALIARYPAYGQMVCRCEGVSEGEILDAIRRPLGAKSLDGIKRRVRAGMGRCQGGFCTPRVVELLAEELGVSPCQITKCGAGSAVLAGLTGEPG